MRVAILTLGDPLTTRGGVETFISHLGKTFEEAEVFSGYKLLSTRNAIPLIRGPQAAAMAVRTFLRRNREEPFDLVISNGSCLWSMDKMSAVPRINIYHGTNAGFSRKIPVTMFPHFWAYGRFIVSFFERLSGSRAHERIAVSQSVQEEVRDFYGLDSQIIHNGVDISEFQPIGKNEARLRLGLPLDKKIVLFVGRLKSVGGYMKGISIIRAVAKQRPKLLILCVAGENGVSSFQTGFDNLLLRFNIPYQDMPVYYSAADLLIFPTYYEGCAYVPLEAMACNLPVVLSMVGAFKHIYPEKAGRVVASQSIDSYIQALDEVLDEDDWSPREFVAKHFPLEKFIFNYERLASRFA